MVPIAMGLLFMIEKVISGAQTGADVAGLKAAKACDILTGGFIPKRYKTLDGPKPEYEELYTFYAVTRRPRPHNNTEFIIMHRLIAGRMGILSNDKPEVDHIDRNGLNNLRSNLRAVNRSQNAHNRKARGYTIDPHGKKPFKVVVAGKYIGRYKTEEEAIVAYNEAKMVITQ